MEKRRVPAPSKPFWLHQNSTSWKEARAILEESKKLQTTLQTTFFPCLGSWLIPYPLVSSEDKYFTAQEIRTLVTCLHFLDHLHQQEVPTILYDGRITIYTRLLQASEIKNLQSGKVPTFIICAQKT